VQKSSGVKDLQRRARGNRDADAAYFNALNAAPLPLHFAWGRGAGVNLGAGGRHSHDRFPHPSSDGIPDASPLPDCDGEEIAGVVRSRASTTAIGAARS
jgi:hypothetical protein